MTKIASLAISTLLLFANIVGIPTDNITVDNIVDSRETAELINIVGSIDKLESSRDSIQEKYNIELPEIQHKSTMKLTIAGDCMLATYKGQIYNGSFSSKALEGDWEYFFDGVDEYFENDDFTIINLENVLTDDKSLKEGLERS